MIKLFNEGFAKGMSAYGGKNQNANEAPLPTTKEGLIPIAARLIPSLHMDFLKAQSYSDLVAMIEKAMKKK